MDRILGAPRPTRWRWRNAVCILLLAMSAGIAGCEKKSPTDPQLQRGFQLLSSDPEAAYAALSKAKDQEDPRTLLGLGLALERLRKYEDSERLLLLSYEKANEPIAALALARVEIVLGKADKARDWITRVLAVAPSDLSALLLETCISDSEERARTTLAHLRRWKEIPLAEKSTTPTVPSEFHLAQKVLFRQLKMRSDFEAAAKKASNAKLSQQRSAFALVELAVKARRFDLAIELLHKLHDEDSLGVNAERIAKLAHGLSDHRLVEQILQTLPGNRRLLTLRAEHDFATGKAQADLTLRRALDATKDDATKFRLWPMLTQALLREGKAEEARVEAEKMQKDQPSQDGLLLLAQVELSAGEPETALKRLDSVLTEKEVPLAAREIAAIAHLELNQPKKARPFLESILKERPGHLRAAQLLISSESKSGKSQEAPQIAEELVAQAPNNVGLRLLLAETVRRVDGNAAAVDSLRKSVDAVKDDARLRLALVQALERNGAEAEALAALEQGHLALPEAQLLSAALAEKLAKVGDAKRAAALYEKFAQGAQDDPVALNNLAMLYVDQLGEVKRGVELAEQAHRLSQAPGIVDTLGWALFKRGAPSDQKRARELLTSVRRKLSSPTSKYHLGAVLVAGGDPTDATEGKALLRQALSLAEEFPEAEQARRLLAADP